MPFLRKTPKDKYYRIVYTENGKQRSMTLKTANKTEAQARLKDFTRHYQLNKIDTPLNRTPDIRISTLMDIYFSIRQITPQTQRMYRLAASHWIRINGDLHPSRYDLRHYAALISYFRSRNISEASIATYIRHLRSLFAFAVKQKYARENIITPVRSPEGRPIRIPQDHIDQLISAASVQLSQIIRFLLLTGFRVSEAVALTWDSIDLARRVITFRNTKANRIDAIPIIDPVHELLSGMTPYKKNKVFNYSNYHAVRSAWRRLLNRTQLNYKIHSLRSTCASNLARLNIPPDTLQKYIRHASLRTTMSYYVYNDLEIMASEINFSLKKSAANTEKTPKT